MKYLVTGGAGFIGSHLCEALTARGEAVVVLDDLSTGRLANIEGLIRSGRVEFVEGDICDEELVRELLAATDACLHLASTVGVSLVVSQPVDTLLRNTRGSDTVISAAAALQKPLLYTSTSEVYGKNDGSALAEGCDRVLGATWKSRWNYATSKSFGEALALGYHRELGADNVVVRLFNTVGPRQVGAYGMVLPRLVRQAITGEDLTVYGDGSQSRCFAHVYDTVDALMRLLIAEGTAGRVFNIGSEAEISILELAKRVVTRADSNSLIRLIPYDEVYDEGFEELGRRKPDTAALRELTRWAPAYTLDDAIDDVIAHERALTTTRTAPAAMNGHLSNGNGLPPLRERREHAR